MRHFIVAAAAFACLAGGTVISFGQEMSSETGYGSGIKVVSENIDQARSAGKRMAEKTFTRKNLAALAARTHIPIWVFGGVAFFAVLLFIFGRRPSLEGASPEESVKKLGRLPAFRWGSEELEAFAKACCALGYLEKPVILKLSDERLDELLNFFYVEKNYRLFCEVLFCKPALYKMVRARTSVDRGELRWVQISDFSSATVEEIYSTLRSREGSNLYFQFLNSFSRQQFAGGSREKALEVIKTVPMETLHSTSWETLLDVSGGISALPVSYLEKLPKQFCARAVLALADEGSATSARLLLERFPRNKWTEEDHFAYFAVQLQTDLEMATEFYRVMAQNFPIRKFADLHYRAALRYEGKGRADMAMEIYRRFISEGIKHKDVETRYEKIRNSFALERRIVTIMMTDIKGYTAKTASSTPQEMMEYLKKHQEILRPLITRCYGHVIKSIGDAFLATFESPSAALRCGMSIQSGLKDYNAGKSEKESINVRVVVHMGEVSVAPDGDIYGDAVNLTSRVEGVAEAGQVWFTDSVCMAVSKTEFSFSELGPHEFKGIPKPVMLYRLN